MDGRALTAVPSSRGNSRFVTDVTFHQSLVGIGEKRSKSKEYSFGSNVSRPFTTIGSSRRSTAEAPPNFSWVDKGWLAASAMPTTPSCNEYSALEKRCEKNTYYISQKLSSKIHADHYKYLFENGIRHVVSLMKQRPQGALECVQLPKLNRLKIRIDDYCAPTVNQIRHFIRIVEDANDRHEAVEVHCANGKGSCGTMLACYLIKTKKISARDALHLIRKLRPGSVESPEQERVIEQFYHYFRNERM